MSLILSLLAPLVKMILLSLYEIKERNNEAIIADDITDGAGNELFSRKLM